MAVAQSQRTASLFRASLAAITERNACITTIMILACLKESSRTCFRVYSSAACGIIFFFAWQITRSASRTQLRAKKSTRPCVRSIEGNDPSSYALCGVHAFPRSHAADTPPVLPPSDANRSRGILLLFASALSTREARPPASTLARRAAAESRPASPHPSGASHRFALYFRAAPASCRWPACFFSWP